MRRSFRPFPALLLAVLIAPPADAGDPWGTLLGDGCPHPSGGTPVAALKSPAFLGNDEFGVEVTGIPGGAGAWLLFSWTSKEWSPWSGCEMFIDPSQMFLWSMEESGPGSAEWSMSLPDVPFLAGLPGFAQVAVVGAEIGVSAGVSFTMEHAECWWGAIAIVSGTGEGLRPRYETMTGSNLDPSFSGPLSFEPIELAGRASGPDLNTGERVEWIGDDPAAPRIALRDVGSLYRTRSTLSGETGLMVVKNDAAQMIPVLNSGSFFNAQIAPTVAVSPDGRTLAAVQSNGFLGAQLWVAATDGVPRHGSSLSANVTPSWIDIDPNSVVFVDESVVFIGTPVLQGGADVLYTAPRDGSAVGTAISLPALGDGSAIQSIDPILMTGGSVVVFTARSPTGSDLLVWNAESGTVANLTQWNDPTRVVDALDDGSETPSGALSADGSTVFFTANVAGVVEAFVAFTRNGASGVPHVVPMSGDELFAPAFDTFDSARFVGFGRILVRVGTDESTGDHYRFRVGSLLGVTEVENVTATSGDLDAPFAAGGQFGAGATFSLGDERFVYVVRPQPVFALYDLVAIDLATSSVISVTGSEFNPTGIPSSTGVRSIERRRVRSESGTIESRTMLVLEQFGAPRLVAFDADDPVAGAVTVASLPFGQDLGDLVFRSDGERVVFVRTASGGSEVHAYDWASQTSALVATIPGVITRGSVRWIHEGTDTIAYAVGTNDSVHPTDAIVEHLALATGARKAVTTTVEDVYLIGTEGVFTTGPCSNWWGNADRTYFGVGKSSYMDVTIGKIGGPELGTIDVTITGLGPTFADGTRTKTVPCAKKTTRFEVLAGAAPGCYTVTVGGRSLSDRINVIEATPEFRNAGTMSTDNECSYKTAGEVSTTLGPATKMNGGLLTNSMELCFTLDPKNGCRAEFEISRLGAVMQYQNGCPGDVTPPFLDDRDNRDEDLTPSAKGNIYSIDGPGIGPQPTFPVGTTFEQHNRFIEFVLVENKGALELLTDGFQWEARVVVRQEPATPVKSSVFEHVVGGCVIQAGWNAVDLFVPYFSPSGPCP